MRMIINSAMVSQEREHGGGCGMVALTGKLDCKGLEVADLLGGHCT